MGLAQLGAGTIMRPKRPEYEIPAAAQEELALSRMQANGRMPGVNYAEQRIGQNSAQAGYNLNRAATNPNQILNGLASIQMNANVASRGLLQAESSDAIRRDSNLRRSLGVMAGYQNRKWELDKLNPFLDAARTKSALIGGGLQNLSNGVGQGLSGLIGANMMGYGGGAGNGSIQQKALGASNPAGNIMDLAKIQGQYLRRDINPIQQTQMNPGDVAPMYGPQNWIDMFLGSNRHRILGMNNAAISAF